MEAQQIATLVHGTYLIEPPTPPKPVHGAPLLVGFHGYGENAEESLAQMMQIPGVAGQWTVVAVQALHRFYRGRGSGTIAASWMTSQDRDRAIADNKDYVRSIVAEFGTPRALVFLGFSQGAAMAYRAASVHPNTTAIVALGEGGEDLGRGSGDESASRLDHPRHRVDGRDPVDPTL